MDGQDRNPGNSKITWWNLKKPLQIREVGRTRVVDAGPLVLVFISAQMGLLSVISLAAPPPGKWWETGRRVWRRWPELPPPSLIIWTPVSRVPSTAAGAATRWLSLSLFCLCLCLYLALSRFFWRWADACCYLHGWMLVWKRGVDGETEGSRSAGNLDLPKKLHKWRMVIAYDGTSFSGRKSSFAGSSLFLLYLFEFTFCCSLCYMGCPGVRIVSSCGRINQLVQIDATYCQ